MTSYVAFNGKPSGGFARGLHYVAVCIVVTAALAASACLDQAPSPGDGTAEAAQALTATSKVCDPASGGSGEPIDVPDSWTIATCASWAKSVGFSDYRVGCVFDDNSFSWGTFHDEPFGAGLPDPNCGWSCVSNAGATCTAGCKCGRISRGVPGSIDCEGKCIAEESCSDVCGF